MIRLLLILLITPALLYGGAIGYIWLKVQGSAEQLTQAASPFAKVSYDSVYISPFGNEIGLDGITIIPNITQDQFRIEKVRFSVPHIGYFISANKSVSDGKLPEHLGLKLQRMQIDLNSELFTMLGQMQQQGMQQQDNPFAKISSGLDALACGELNKFEISDYRNMGVGVVVADADFSIGYDESINSTQIKANIKTDRLYNLDMTFDLPMKPGAISKFNTKRIPKTTVNYIDNGYYKLRNNYCSGLNGGSDEEYVTEHVELMGQALNATFPETITSEYKKYMLNGGTFMVRIDPENEVPLDGIEYYKPSDIIDMLGLSIFINNKPVDTNSIQWSGDQSPAMTESVADAKANETKLSNERPLSHETDNTPAVRKTRAEASYHVVDVSNAEKHLNRMAEITTREGNKRRGQIHRVTADSITLIIKMTSGSMTYPVENYRIDTLRVRY